MQKLKQKKQNRMIVADIGAGSGRVFTCQLEREALHFEESYRFEHDSYDNKGTTYWDFTGVYENIMAGMKRAINNEEGCRFSFAVDSWAPDFCILDEATGEMGEMLSYRDEGLNDTLSYILTMMPEEKLFSITGNKPFHISILSELILLRKKGVDIGSDIKILPLCSAINYMLCGTKSIDPTVASASLLFDYKKMSWSKEILDKFDINYGILPEVEKAPRLFGSINREVALRNKLPAIDIAAVGAHDTALALYILGLLAAENDILINSGTWSVIAVECVNPVISDSVLEEGFTNYEIANGKYAVLKLLPGLYYVQQLIKQYKYQGYDIEYKDIAEIIKSDSLSAKYIIDIEDLPVISQKDVESAILEKCQDIYGKGPETKAAIFRCVYESIAVKYSNIIGKMETVTGKKIKSIHLSGGACNDELLCQMISDACKRQVVSGPVESTVLGNCLMQCQTLGLVKSENNLKEILNNSINIKKYYPRIKL